MVDRGDDDAAAARGMESVLFALELVLLAGETLRLAAALGASALEGVSLRSRAPSKSVEKREEKKRGDVAQKGETACLFFLRLSTRAKEKNEYFLKTKKRKTKKKEERREMERAKEPSE